MKITKEDEENKLSVYTPDENEKEKLYEVSDKIIDLIESYKLTDDQHIHLISSLYVSMKEMFGIDKMKHLEDSSSD